jgi:predicted TIM-barrel fold metal-dependent hydrolase
VTLNCHSGAVIHNFTGAGLAYRALFWSEIHFLGHLPLSMMSFSGVFERHPRLRVVFNEQRGYWVPQTLRDLDAIYMSPWNRELRAEVPKKPSEYWHDNCFLGGSFLAHFELVERQEIGIDNITWGRDYPHVEGTWPFSLEALRHAFSDVPPDEVAKMLGDNGVRCYGLDAERLGQIAQRIGPTVDEVAQPIAAAPPGSYSFAFRDLESAPGGARFGAY